VKFRDKRSVFVAIDLEGHILALMHLRSATVQKGVTDVLSEAHLVAKNGAQMMTSKRKVPLAAPGDAVPGRTGETITWLSSPVGNASYNAPSVAFVVGSSGEVGGKAICWYDVESGDLRTLAQTRDIAPDSGGARFAEFKSLAMLPERGPVFLARIGESGLVRSGNDRGIWVADGTGRLSLVLREGETIETAAGRRVIRKIDAFRVVRDSSTQGRSLSGTTPQLVFRAHFTDGTSGIIQSTIP
jgi:hypothetical protein